MNIAFIGLGNMGAPMARNLLKAGHSLNLFDLNKDILAELAAQGGHISASPREAAQGAQYDSKTEIGWGHQIRSYVLQPYQMIKDLRTGVERTDSQVVLDGDLDDYLHASLALK